MGKIFIKKLKVGSIFVKNKKMPLCFTAQQANSTIKLNGDWSSSSGSSTPYSSDPYGGGSTTYKVNLEYKLEGTTTQGWTRYTGQTITLSNIDDKMYMRAMAEGNTTISSGGYYYKFEMTGKIAASGNIQTLLDQTGNRMDVPTYCYFQMFRDCTSLTQAPELPATTLANNCYNSMFQYCTSLTTAPELTSTILADYCYSSMFNGCASLTSAPELPATTLASYCYYYMFNGCSKFSTVKMKKSMDGVYSTRTHGDIRKTVEYVL